MGHPARIRDLFEHFRTGTLARNTIWMLGGRGVRIVLQAVYFILIARALGASEYGAFIGAVSLVSLAASFSGWGFGWMLVEEVSRDRNAFPLAWGSAILMILLSGTALLCLIVLLTHFALGASFSVAILALVGVSDLLAVRLIDLAGQAFQAIEVLRRAAEVDAVLGAVRTAAAILLFFLKSDASAFLWSWLYLGSGVIAAVYAFTLVSKKIGMPRFSLSLTGRQLHDGFFYAISIASQTAYNDIDKTMLVRMQGLAATGIYGAAYRIIDVSFTPISALVYASSARFFQHGASGVPRSTEYARKLLPYVLFYALLATFVVIAASPLIRIVLGGHFAESSSAVRWLAPIILFRGVHYLFSNALTGAGLQRIRSVIQIAVAGMNVLLNFWLIPAYSWRGAAYASLICDGSLVLLFWYATQTMIAKTAALAPLNIEDCERFELDSR